MSIDTSPDSDSTDSDQTEKQTKQTSLVAPEEKIRMVLERASRREYDFVLALVSGGVDSLTALKAVLKYGSEYGIEVDAVCHINTGTNIPATTETVQEFAAEHGLPYIEGRNQTRKELVGPQVLDYGWPGPGEGRVMIDRKHATAYVLRKERVEDGLYSGFSGQILNISGAYADESDQRARKMAQGAVEFGKTGDRKPRRTMMSPIYALTEDEVADLGDEWQIPRTVAYEILGASGDCTGCAFSQTGRFGNLWAVAPNLAYCFATLMVWTQMRRACGKLNLPPERVFWGWGNLDEDTIEALRAEDEFYDPDAPIGPENADVAASLDPDDFEDVESPDSPDRDLDHTLKKFTCSDCDERCEPAILVTSSEGGS